MQPMRISLFPDCSFHLYRFLQLKTRRVVSQIKIKNGLGCVPDTWPVGSNIKSFFAQLYLSPPVQYKSEFRDPTCGDPMLEEICWENTIQYTWILPRNSCQWKQVWIDQYFDFKPCYYDSQLGISIYHMYKYLYRFFEV